MSERIIVCDDEVHITRAVSMKLKKAGFDIETASDGLLGWEAIKRRPPVLLLTDYQMPRENGMNLIRRVRAEPSLKGLPIILLTAKGFEVNPVELSRQWDPIQVMCKPFSLKEVLECVQEMILTSHRAQSVSPSTSLEN